MWYLFCFCVWSSNWVQVWQYPHSYFSATSLYFEHPCCVHKNRADGTRWIHHTPNSWVLCWFICQALEQSKWPKCTSLAHWLCLSFGVGAVSTCGVMAAPVVWRDNQCCSSTAEHRMEFEWRQGNSCKSPAGTLVSTLTSSAQRISCQPCRFTHILPDVSD